MKLGESKLCVDCEELFCNETKEDGRVQRVDVCPGCGGSQWIVLGNTTLYDNARIRSLFVLPDSFLKV